MNRFLLSLILVMPFSIVFTSSETNHHHRLEEEINLMEKAEKKLKSLQDEVAEYFDYRAKLKKDNEILLKEINEFDAMEKEDERFKEALKELEHDFLKFRESLGRFIAETDSYSPYASTLRASSILSATEWYVDHIKSIAFPENWKQAKKSN